MSLVRLLSLVFIAIAFGVLVWTFVWVARLLARREAAATAAAAAGAQDAEGEDAEDEAAAAAALRRRRVGTGVNATLGLLLSLMACILFWLSPFVLALSVAGVYFSGNALWFGLRRLRVFIVRAALGLVFGLASVVLFFAHRLGQFEGFLP